MYLITFPLRLLPMVLYNMIAFLLNMPFIETVFALPLSSDRRLSLSIGDTLIGFAMLLFYVEVLKAGRFGGKAAIDHLLSLILLAAMLGELVAFPRASSPTLLLLSILGFVDL